MISKLLGKQQQHDIISILLRKQQELARKERQHAMISKFLGKQ